MTVSVREFSFDVSGPLAGGRVVFRIVNDGNESHAPMLVPLDEAFPPIGEALRQSNQLPFGPLGTINPRPPGKAAAFAVDLQPGQRYALVCRSRSADGVPHTEKGMMWESRAGAYPVSPAG